MVYRVIGIVGGVRLFIIGFTNTRSKARFIKQGWKAGDIEFVKCTNRE